MRFIGGLFFGLLATYASLGSALAAVVITVDKAEQRMSVAVNGETRHAWAVSTGKAGYSTPKGTFSAFRME